MKMIDVGEKRRTHRVAIASGRIRMSAETLRLIETRQVEKGDVLAAARLAGIMAVKRTPDLVPLCHPISISRAEVELAADRRLPGLFVRAQVENRDRTGVEMEALTAVCAACLTIYDMCKSVEPGMTIGDVRLEAKSGGKSGAWRAPGLDISAAVVPPPDPARAKRGRSRRTRGRSRGTRAG